MPGPLLAPLNLDFLTKGAAAIGNDIATIWRQNRHPVYNASGQIVGSYDTLDALCQGQWFVDKGAVQPPPSQLYVVDFWGNKTPLATLCVRSAAANATGGGSIVFPQAVQPASAEVAQAAANEAETGDPSPVDLVDLAGPSLDQATLQNFGTYALWGGVGILGLMVLMGGDHGKGRR